MKSSRARDINEGNHGWMDGLVVGWLGGSNVVFGERYIYIMGKQAGRQGTWRANGIIWRKVYPNTTTSYKWLQLDYALSFYIYQKAYPQCGQMDGRRFCSE